MINIGLRHNILIKNSSIIERIFSTKNVIFDKTGTLFTSSSEVELVDGEGVRSDLTTLDFWKLILLLEQHSSHRIA
jgi:cation transport ATPase